MIYDVLRFPSFAHVEFAAVGAFIAFSISMALPISPGWAVFVGAVVAAVVVGGLGVLSDRLIFSKLRYSSPIILMIASFGLGIIMRFGAQEIGRTSCRESVCQYV